ncbi:MAG: endonuclease domain-containing protein [Burkholderiales bacterium]|nr:endonuclease domain-containing protein [Burkholderiales bacterium]
MAALVHLARQLRKNQTDVERVFWNQVRAGRLDGWKFRRQQPIGHYIVDFVCLDAMLIVELDGGQHADSEGDAERDEWLRNQGFRVLRFWNNEVATNLEGVMSEVARCLHTPLPNPLP